MKRSEIQKAFLKISPDSKREKQGVWFSKVSSRLQSQDRRWNAARVQTLWKDDRATLKDWEGQSIRNLLTASSAQPRANIIQKNNEDLEEIREYRKQLKQELKNEVAREIIQTLQSALANTLGAGVR